LQEFDTPGTLAKPVGCQEDHVVEDRGTKLGRGMRWLLLLCGPMNLVGAVCFAPPFPTARGLMGLPEPAPFYLWVLSAWILAFGLAFFVQGWTGRADSGVLALAAWGKGVFAALLLGMAATGEAHPFAVTAALPDLALAAVFAIWLWRTRPATNPADRA
jgi:hypothetical protein